MRSTMILTAAALLALAACSSGTDAEPSAEAGVTAPATPSPTQQTTPAGAAESTPSPSAPSAPTTTASAAASSAAASTAKPTGRPATRTTVQVGGTLHIMGPELYETVAGTKVEPHTGDEWSQECYGVGTAAGLGPDTAVRIVDTDGAKVASGRIVATHGGPKGSTRLEQACLLEWSADIPAGRKGALRAVFGDTGASTNEFTLGKGAPKQGLDLFVGNQ